MVRYLFLVVFLVGTTSALAQLEQALAAERWIRTQRVEHAPGVYWRVYPGDSGITTNLYSGSAGVVLFYAELFHTTRNPDFLREAEAGARFLIHHYSSRALTQDEVGFYTGLAGACFTVKKVYDLSRKSELLAGYQKLMRQLFASARVRNKSAGWQYTDVVYGASGIGLFLLRANDDISNDLAMRTGNQLLEVAQPAEGGVRWFMDSTLMKQGYYMPNFSHGTAGNGYFLLRLYQKTKDKRYLDKALQAAAHLATIEHDNKWIRHHDGNGRDIFYVSWCHGPAGTARFYYELFRVTQDSAWVKRIEQAAQALMTCGIPGQQSPGFWNNQAPCCGSAGVAEFFLDLHLLLKRKEYLDFSMVMTEDIIKRGRSEGDRLFWPQAEHRRQPDLIQAQTGYMQGAAGIGLWLLHLHQYRDNIKPAVVFPDKSY
ncbi:MAG: lanthionine synthetase LanC family protein [Cyclobacteriaceae bacterium]|jgi:lantibiotic modifying enzyme|nr:hypothetical protein [Flammeovirgaceae bacterium]